ncbi:hypothetical protein INR49_002531 [Caranx melampygus]|nr:hypothetical protein INR49_002531 [Caranx melampygus]
MHQRERLDVGAAPCSQDNVRLPFSSVFLLFSKSCPETKEPVRTPQKKMEQESSVIRGDSDVIKSLVKLEVVLSQMRFNED